MVEGAKRFALLLTTLAVAVLLAQAAFADVLVTRTGRYEGKITEGEYSYIVIQTDGRKMTFPKSVVRQVIRSEKFRPQYEKMLTAADLSDDSQVQKLAEFTTKGGLTKERKKLLAKAYDLRYAKAEGNQQLLEELARWCMKYNMTGEISGMKWEDLNGDGIRNGDRIRIDLFDNKTIEIVVRGSEKPYTDADGVEHGWYGRCMIAIVDENRWIMALRSGVNHIDWGSRDTIHLITSTNEGRTWSELNRWFDGTPIDGMPYEDGHCHSEPGLFRMPNGDLILQFWRTAYTSGTKQLRSTDNGKTWTTDIDRISVVGVPGADDDMVIGTEDYFVDPENPSDVYMAFQYYDYSESGCVLARSQDNCKSYSFLSWMSPLTDVSAPDSSAAFEPAIEYVGNRTIVGVMRGYPNRRTWQTVSTNMGASFSPQTDISDQINGGVSNGLWQRARIYKESNPYFQYNNQLDYASGQGRLWGFGIHSMGGDYTRKPVVYWSDDNGQSWQGPELLHGPMYPGTDTGYGDLKRRVDGTFVAATYYCQPGDFGVADVEQYTFSGFYELGLEGWTIFLDQNENGILDGGETSTLTDADGNYSFTGLIPGPYNVAEVLQDNWAQSAPTEGSYQVTINSGDVITGRDFGNYELGQIHGTKWEDLNADGVAQKLPQGGRTRARMKHVGSKVTP